MTVEALEYWNIENVWKVECGGASWEHQWLFSWWFFYFNWVFLFVGCYRASLFLSCIIGQEPFGLLFCLCFLPYGGFPVMSDKINLLGVANLAKARGSRDR